MLIPRIPLVSFFIPSYNHGKYIGECLESILNQTATRDLEVVIVDDGSQDESDHVIKSFRDPRIRYIRQTQTLGLIPTLNMAVAETRGQFIVRQDSDNRCRTDFLEQTLPLFEQAPPVGLVYGDVAAMDADGKILAEPWAGIRSREAHHGRAFRGNEFAALLLENFLPTPALIARREAWQLAFPLPAWLPKLFTFDDWYALSRMTRVYDSQYLPRILADYRLHTGNLHARFKQDPAQEHAVVRVLDELFAELPDTPNSRQLGRSAYAEVYRIFGDRYFAVGMDAEARRCYMQAFRYNLPGLPRHGTAQRWAATFLGHSRYESVKRWVKHTPVESHAGSEPAVLEGQGGEGSKGP